jgi:DNA-binding NtrC family response regulator
MASPASASPPPASGSRPRTPPAGDELVPLDILLVEDEPDILDLVGEVLARRGHRVTAVADGADAMTWLDRRFFDVAVCDVRLPSVDGMRIFHRIRAESPRCQVILMSAYGSVAEAVAAMQEDATHYLAKPFSMDVLLELVERIQQQRQLEERLGAGRWSGEDGDASPLIGASPSMFRLRELVRTIGSSDASVMITGESGTGKELVAREIHRASARADRPLVALNCAAFPETLLEAELFGHEKGAYTGAHSGREGRFGAADGGTLFLDELAEMPLTSQAKLLRVLEEGCYQRLGSNKSIPVDVRLISATNIDVRDALEQGKLRKDIYHRLKVFHLELPALRDRRADLPLLIGHFYERRRGPDAPPLQITPRAWAALRHYGYPGNVRELKHIVEHALVLSGSEQIDLCHLPEELRGEDLPERASDRLLPLAEAVADFEREYLLRALRRCKWHKAQTAELMGVSRKTLWHKLKLYDIDGP